MVAAWQYNWPRPAIDRQINIVSSGACHAERSEASQSSHTEILRFAQDDRLSGLTDIIFLTLNNGARAGLA